jgi:hypothetical protein
MRSTLASVLEPFKKSLMHVNICFLSKGMLLHDIHRVSTRRAMICDNRVQGMLDCRIDSVHPHTHRPLLL